jgi:pimeloyl-ACP methyl ester carboxylesterase
MTDYDKTITLSDGRKLGFAEYGDLNGKPVFHFNGSGGSRLDRPANLSDLIDLGIRLISTDRAGHGLSDPLPKRNVLNWADDILELADQLCIDKFYVMGHSAGGPYALACAFKLNDRVIACGIISGLAPPDRPSPYRGLSFPLKVLMFAMRNFSKINYFLKNQMAKVIQLDDDEIGEKLLSGFPIEDQEHLKKPKILEILVKEIKEGYRQGPVGPAQDDIVINTPWGFSIDEITVPTFIWHGQVDRNVPVNNGKYLHQMISASQFMLVKGQAHLYFYSMWKEILDKLTSSLK